MAAKGYWTANSIVRDMDGLYRYRDANRGKFIIMHRQHQDVEESGNLYPSWTVVEFPSYEAAVACYEDPGCQEAAKIRHSVAEGAMTIVEGYDGTQEFLGRRRRPWHQAQLISPQTATAGQSAGLGGRLACIRSHGGSVLRAEPQRTVLT